MSKRRYRKILRKLNESKLVPLPKTRGYLGDQKRVAQLYENLWSQFGMDKERREKMRAKVVKANPGVYGRHLDALLPCVNEWAWTAEAKAAFYNHPHHKAFVKKLRKQHPMAWGMWVLDSEPAGPDPEACDK